LKKKVFPNHGCSEADILHRRWDKLQGPSALSPPACLECANARTLPGPSSSLVTDQIGSRGNRLNGVSGESLDRKARRRALYDENLALFLFLPARATLDGLIELACYTPSRPLPLLASLPRLLPSVRFDHRHLPPLDYPAIVTGGSYPRGR
jgi:hypothetical protein